MPDQVQLPLYEAIASPARALPDPYRRLPCPACKASAGEPCHAGCESHEPVRRLVDPDAL